jgi:sodium-dependent dicarboxylate transporter 2/3/5
MMCATSGISMFVNNTSTTLLMLPIALALLSSFEGCGRGERTAFARALLLGVAYSASVGGIGTPVGTAPNQIFLGQFRERYPDAGEISFVQWALAWLPVVILYLPIGWLLLTRVLFRVPADMGHGGDVLAAERRALGRWGPGETRMAALFGLAALLWLTRADLELGAVRFEGGGDLLRGGLERSPVRTRRWRSRSPWPRSSSRAGCGAARRSSTGERRARCRGTCSCSSAAASRSRARSRRAGWMP